MSNEEMIKEILTQGKASGVYTSGDMFFCLAFRTTSELKQICQELGIAVSS